MWRLLILLLIVVAGTAPTASWAETPTLPWQKYTNRTAAAGGDLETLAKLGGKHDSTSL